MTARFGVFSHVVDGRATAAGVTRACRARSASSRPGSPVKVLYWFSTSALPPKPPMRSRPEMNSDSCLFFARSTSAAVGPSFASLAISSVTIVSISRQRASRPRRGLHDEHPLISPDTLNAVTLRGDLPVVHQRAVQTRRQSVAQDARGDVERCVPALKYSGAGQPM